MRSKIWPIYSQKSWRWRPTIFFHVMLEIYTTNYLRNKMFFETLPNQLEFHEATNLGRTSIPRVAAERVKTGSDYCRVGGMTGPRPKSESRSTPEDSGAGSGPTWISRIRMAPHE